VYTTRRRFLDAREAYHRALELEPDDVSTNLWLGISLMTEGYVHQGSQVLDRLLAIDPILPNALLWRGTAAFDDGDVALAERLIVRSQDLGLAHVGVGLALIADARGDKDEAVRQMTRALEVLGADLPPGSAEAVARGIFGDTQARGKAVALVDGYLATRPAVMPGAVPYALLRLGQTARALEVLEAGPTANDSMVFTLLWGAPGRAARTAPAFAEFARRTGLADLWDREGAPDKCQRVGPRDYACR
jgi:tetratricopeptide (TPR) repeat protein